MVNKPASDDLRALGVLYGKSKLETYEGPSQFIDLYASNDALKLITCLIGSQCKDLNWSECDQISLFLHFSNGTLVAV